MHKATTTKMRAIIFSVSIPILTAGLGACALKTPLGSWALVNQTAQDAGLATTNLAVVGSAANAGQSLPVLELFCNP